jgi:hypothetical protein
MLWVLIHSPLVGPFTWQPVGNVLASKGFRVAVPELDNDKPEETGTFWEYHAEKVVQRVESAHAAGPCLLAAHSGAGVLLPAIAGRLRGRVCGSVFVDAILPENGKSRLDLFDTPDEAQAFRDAAVDGFLPVWTEEDLVSAIPDRERRRRFVRELRPVPLAVYEEPVPVWQGWPDHPCAFLRFSSGYDRMFSRAKEQDWPADELPGSHFHLLVDPEEVANRLIRLTKRMNLPLG